MRTDRQDEGDSRISKFWEKAPKMVREVWGKRAWTGFIWLRIRVVAGRSVINKRSGSIVCKEFFY
jgi:hypothetical protein